MHRLLAVALLVGLSACGSRTGLGLGGARDAGLDARPRDSGRDARTDGFVPFDAGDDPLACDGRPLPRPLGTATHETPPRMHGLGVLIPDPLGIIFAGGLTSSGVYAEQMAFLDLSRATAQELPVLGDRVALPLGSGIAVYVPGRDQVVVVGGLVSDGSPTDQAFIFTGEGDPGGLRRVRAQRIESFPLGGVMGHVGVYDPVGDRVIVHGGSGRMGDPDVFRTTWALELAGGLPVWRRLVAADESPSLNSRAMGYDPERHRAIEISDDEDGEGAAVYALELEPGRERWVRLGPIDFVPSVRGELLYDPRVCGFHLLSARRTRCVLEHWVLAVDDGAITVFRGEPELDPSHFIGSATFVAVRDELLVYASELCERTGLPNTSAHAITLGR